MDTRLLGRRREDRWTQGHWGEDTRTEGNKDRRTQGHWRRERRTGGNKDTGDNTGGQVETRTLGEDTLHSFLSPMTPADLSSEMRESMSGGWESWILLTGCQPLLARENWLTV